MLANMVKLFAASAIRLLLIAVCLLFGFESICSGQEAMKSIDSESSAIVAANLITNLELMFKDKQSVASVTKAFNSTYIDTTTPFIHSKLNGKSVWRVSYGQFTPIIDSLNIGKERQFPKSCVVWIDSLTGQLLRADFFSIADSVVPFRSLNAKESEVQIRSVSEKYIGLPKKMPNVSMIEAIRTVEIDFLVSKQAIVQYLIVSVGQSEPFPAWVIYLRGVGTFSFAHTEDLAAKSFARTIVNAESGKSYGVTNVPYPTTQGVNENLRRGGENKLPIPD